ncbi:MULTISPECIES: TRAP transporter large permease [Halomonadaceae]|uniref:TRAP transporter large permease n=1 Tax=Halomonadaceae TaxID=28256 RepID=UPI00059AE3F0|nr:MULTISPECIES: TRAP transporter large permease [Halomonas]KIN15708.1 C4-dicarboxylate ABC transporter permease [Halomonas sp. KHS3]CAD5268118.1 C4-dicarboxylate ABC transporter permease [Halomonas sp. I3]CAD5273920.1 C4-dicarboxylate ABC transporter permease [Halomonas sp. 113]CAD5275545.1 C4-dicarboxylate ABC transporter permease [Halomonas sp. 59]CAD5278070.1 C4-dicarboxylate ABC transporter permease [Halomonas sp. 156]
MFEVFATLSSGSQMILVFFLLLLLRVPVAFSLGLSAIYAMWHMGFGLDMVGDLIATGITKFSLLAIPFFILAGTLMGVLGIAERMVLFFRVLVGGLPGGMGVVGTVVCLFWGAVSGSGPASVAAIGPMIIKGMEEDGYRKAYAAGLVCTGAALSIVIPPSIGLVIYGVIAETSISKLFLAAIIPGLLMGGIMILTLPLGRDKGAKTGKVDELCLATMGDLVDTNLSYKKRLWSTFRDSFWGLLTPVVILGGIYSGAFTPTEAALVATVYALFVGGLAYRTLTLKKLYEALSDAAASSSVVMLVVAYASLFGWVVTVDDLVGTYSGLLLGLSSNEWVILLVIMLILLIVGMFMDAVTVMFISLPIFMPVVHEMGWDPIWFGVLLMINLSIGLITPPVGINLYVAANVTKLSIESVAKGALPFVFTCLLGLVIVAAFPTLSLMLIEIFR